MTVFADVLKAPVKTDELASREDILELCRLCREERVTRLAPSVFRKAA